MALRKFPYGYEMKNGETAVCESEAKTVRYIFAQRANGKSNRQIAKELFESGEPYFGDSVNKSSCKISSIIYDKRYIGMDGYERIVDDGLFDKVQELKGEAYCKKRKKSDTQKSDTQKSDTQSCTVQNNTSQNVMTSTILIPSKAVFEKEKQLKELLKNSDKNCENADKNNDNASTEAIKNLIFELAEEKYNCIQ